MKKILSIIFTLCIAVANSQNWEWVKLMQPASNINNSMGIVVGPNGNVFGYGSYQGSMAFTNGITINGNAGFICMFDTAGQCQWAQTIKPSSGCGCTNLLPVSIKIYGFDNVGNIIAAGTYCGCGTDFGNGVTTPDIANTMFLAKFNTSGQCQWVKTKSSTSADFIYDVTIDKQDNVYMSISNNANSVTFCGLNFPSSADYITKINSNGIGIWVFSTGSSYELNRIFYNKNRLYALGLFAGTATLGPNTFTANGAADGFVAIMDTAGHILQSANIAGPGIESPLSISKSGNTICILDKTNSSLISVGTYTINTDNSHDKSFLITYDTSLNVLNARNTSGDSLGGGTFMTSDKFGNIYVLANNGFTTNFGNLTNVPVGHHIFKMDNNLQNHWYLENVNTCVAPDTLGSIYITDHFATSNTYGPFTENATNGITLGKIQHTLTPIGGPAGRQGNNMSVYPNPSVGLFNLKLSNAIKNKKGISIILYDANGKQIDNIPYTQNDDYTLQVNLTNYAQGLYMVKVQLDGVLYSAKLER